MTDSSSLQFDVMVYHLQFECEAQAIVHFGPQAGAQLRGALWAALREFACTDKHARSDPHHAHHCPMCRLMALETRTSRRGANPARPFAIQPPLTGSHFEAGEYFAFGISLFGDVAELVPYIVQAGYRMGQIGVGYGRGQFALKRILTVNPLNGHQRDILIDGRISLTNLMPASRDQVERIAMQLPRSSIRLRFLTPTQIVSNGKFDSQPVFAHLMARLIERCQSIEAHYARTPTEQRLWLAAYNDLTVRAQKVKLAQNQTRWFRVRSGSHRDDRSKPISGFVGDALFEGPLAPFHRWLVWGQSLHIGKNAVKGNGWYQIVTSR